MPMLYTWHFAWRRLVKGTKYSRCWPFRYRSPGGRFEVATKTTPCRQSSLNSPSRIIASHMSVTWNSSKQSSCASLASWPATTTIASRSDTNTVCCFLNLWIRACTSSINSLKWVLRLALICIWRKKSSINMVFPVPTSPYRYRPRLLLASGMRLGVRLGLPFASACVKIDDSNFNFSLSNNPRICIWFSSYSSLPSTTFFL